MRSDHESFDELEWTPEERARLDALPRELAPRPELKAKTMLALRNDGLLGAARRFSPRAIAAMLLAASLLFSAGALVGYAAGERRAEARVEVTPVAQRDLASIDSVKTSPASVRHVVWY